MTAVLLTVEQLRRRVPGGIGTYATNLATSLATLSDRPDVVLHASRRRAADSSAGDGDSGGDPIAGLGLDLRGSRLPGPLLTRLWDAGLSWVARDFALVHATSLAAPPPWGRPLVVTVHDLAWREVPEAYPPRGRRWHEAALRRAGVRAAAYVVPSEATANALVGSGVQRDRVGVVPHGADHLPEPDGEATTRFLEELGVSSPYLLAVGTLEPRKNLRRLFAAYAIARPLLPEPWPLVVVGPVGWGDEVERVEGVVLAGAVAAAVLSGLYAGARCSAYVPLVEGFGLPVVESMRAGSPVVASPVPAGGGAALEVDPLDTEAIASALVAAAGDDVRRQVLREAGFARTAGLTWRLAAERHVELWRRVLAEGPASADDAAGVDRL